MQDRNGRGGIHDRYDNRRYNDATRNQERDVYPLNVTRSDKRRYGRDDRTIRIEMGQVVEKGGSMAHLGHRLQDMEVGMLRMSTGSNNIGAKQREPMRLRGTSHKSL